MDFLFGKITTIIIIIAILLLFCLIIWMIVRCKKSRRKVKQMCNSQKNRLLNELAEPFGFCYIPPNPYRGIWSEREEDIFKSSVDAWQRKQGYEAFYDKAAARVHMIFDSWPVYFDYEGKTWLIELWKGQYGINTGAEVGVYHADRIVPKEKRKLAHFEAVSDEEMPYISFCLEKKNRKLIAAEARHWWLAAFRMGVFSCPKDLTLSVKIRFDEIEQAAAFMEGLKESGKCGICRRNCCEVCICMDFTRRYHCFIKIYRCWIQFLNWVSCKLYLLVTRPFHTTVDRMLYLYFLLPKCFRKMLHIRPICRKKSRKRVYDEL